MYKNFIALVSCKILLHSPAQFTDKRTKVKCKVFFYHFTHFEELFTSQSWWNWFVGSGGRSSAGLLSFGIFQ